MTVDEMVKRWASRKLTMPYNPIPPEDIFKVEFRHEDGYDNDSDTYWPEENYAIVTLGGESSLRAGPSNQRRIEIDGIEGLPGLIREITQGE